jgi:chromosome segregation protein
LLKLRKVELVGFKSFCERTQLTFSGTGLSCIIGPNGCGKSNVVDAISWVLGEQSHKSLRAQRMADCIFNGTAKRPPTGLAQVTLTLVDPELADAARRVLEGSDPADGAEEAAADPLDAVSSLPAEEHSEGPSAPADAATGEEAKSIRGKRRSQKPADRPGEVVIARKLFRSGQSEYLINGRAARLRDIQELFMGVGLGPDSYAIIEQGRIGQVLSSKPSDRRAIIEEAAGITKYKTKKRLAEAKLESSRLNLARVNDIYVEVEKQLASLKRQASKARRYAELREQMRALLRRLLANKARELDSQAERIGRLLEEITGRETQHSQMITRLEGEQGQLDQRTYEMDAELRQNQNQIGQAALEVDRAENQILFNRQRSGELLQREQQLAGERDQVSAMIARGDARIAAQAEVVAGLRNEAERLEAALFGLASRSATLANSAQDAEARIAELRRRTAALDESLSRLQDVQSQAEQSVARHSGALERLDASEQQLLAERLGIQQRLEAAETRWQTVTRQAHELEQAVISAQIRLGELQHRHQQATARRDTLRDSLARVRARRQTLEQILNDRSYTAEAVQKLFASRHGANGRNFQAVGTLADYAEVEPQYENAVEQFLREELQYVVVETFDHARAGIAMLREEVGGRATFFVDSLRSLNLDAPSPAVLFAAEPAVVSRLDRLVEFRNPLGSAAKQFLPRLQSAFLVETAEAAERLARENPSLSFLTPDGTCYQGRAVTGGRPADAGPLAMKRELRALDADALSLERETTEAQAAVELLAADRKQTESALAEATAKHVEVEKAVVAATLERNQASGELAGVETETTACQNEIGRLRQEVESARRQAEDAVEQRRQVLHGREVADREAAEAATGIAQMRQMAQAQQEELGGKRAEKAAIDERLASAETLSARLAEERAELAARAAAIESQQAAVASDLEALARQSEEQQRQAEALRTERQRLEQHRSELEREWEQARARTAEVDDALRMARQQLSDLREQRGHAEVDRARNDAEREHLRETCRNELNAQPEDLIVDPMEPLEAEALAAADDQYQQMKSRMESMGPVNMMALEEYNECEQRFAFLGREREDLLQSIADTQQAITELDQISHRKFEEAFAVINTHFAAAFQTLFGGGTGQMRLTEPDSSGETGIDIAAQPPGKRLQNVLLLSGGEKALAALALLIAIFRFQPSPFCILDEVDAPLDESNVGRFAQMVAEMSAEAQFIVVTHNRRTMEKASVLYGVTMQEPGVSRLVSVSWEQLGAVSSSNAA